MAKVTQNFLQCAGPFPGFRVGPVEEASVKTSTYLLSPGYQQNMLIVM